MSTVTRALSQKDLLRKRRRAVRAPRASEFQIHAAIVTYLRQAARPDVQWWHTGNGEIRDERTGAKIKAMGLRPGAPDLTFRWRARWSLDCLTECLDMEIKTASGKQSNTQIEWQKAAQAVGAHYCIVRSLDEAIDVFERYGITRNRQAMGIARQ